MCQLKVVFLFRRLESKNNAGKFYTLLFLMTDFNTLCTRLIELWDADCDIDVEINELRAALTESRISSHVNSANTSDGPAMSDDSDDREPASVMDQLKYQLFLKVKADLIREVINQALKDTASVHWRVTDTGEQIVRVGDLLRWAEQAANKMEKTDVI